MNKRRLLAPLVVFGMLAVLSGGATFATAELATVQRPVPGTVRAPNGLLPQLVHHAGADTRDAYQAALDAPQTLAAVPCTCGCVALLGHANNLDCYVDSVDANGVVVFSTHGLDCYVCQVITRDAIAGAAAGMSDAELHQMIVDRYTYGG